MSLAQRVGAVILTGVALIVSACGGGTATPSGSASASTSGGAAKVSIPLLCAAGIVMISPANTYPGLTKPGKGEADEPGKYYQGCTHNYFRVVPADDIQGAVGAVWLQSMGAKKVYIVHDTQLYGKGIADVFRAKWKSLNGTEAGYEGAEKADNYKALANKIKDSGADAVYYGGQYVALVIAETIEQARYAASLVKVSYAPEEPLLTMEAEVK